MNKVYSSKNMEVHDDREFITADEAFNLLWNGKSISICDPPNYAAENEFEIYSHPFTLCLTDITIDRPWEVMSLAGAKRTVLQYLEGYELSK